MPFGKILDDKVTFIKKKYTIIRNKIESSGKHRLQNLQKHEDFFLHT